MIEGFPGTARVSSPVALPHVYNMMQSNIHDDHFNDFKHDTVG